MVCSRLLPDSHTHTSSLLQSPIPPRLFQMEGGGLPTPLTAAQRASTSTSNRRPTSPPRAKSEAATRPAQPRAPPQATSTAATPAQPPQPSALPVGAKPRTPARARVGAAYRRGARRGRGRSVQRRRPHSARSRASSSRGSSSSWDAYSRLSLSSLGSSFMSSASDVSDLEIVNGGVHIKGAWQPPPGNAHLP